MRGSERYSANNDKLLLSDATEACDDLRNILKVSASMSAIPAIAFLGFVTGNLAAGLTLGVRLGNFLQGVAKDLRHS
jgi:hypothetical protein